MPFAGPLFSSLLGVGHADDGTVLLKCHGGRSAQDITKALGLGMADLYPSKTKSRPRGKIVQTYDYLYEADKLLCQTVRFEPKDFRQRRPDGKGRWKWNLDGVRRLLYRLPNVLAAEQDDIVFAPEGEKDVDRLAGLGLIATTCPMGGGKWSKVDVSHCTADTLSSSRTMTTPVASTPEK